jgi:flagellar biosynthesis GTPase FlhF
MANEKLTDTDVTAIDKAIVAAKQRKATREGNGSPTAEAAPKAAKAPKAESTPKRPRLTDEEKAARETTRQEERAAKKAARETARAEKRAARDANRQPAHMRKVMKAAERLGSLGQAAQLLFNEATANLTAAELATLALHIQHHNRVQSTSRALTQTLDNGTQVRINGGDPRFIGKTGTISKAQRIRCYVTVPGFKKDVYLFTSDVEVIAAAQASEPAAVAG